MPWERSAAAYPDGNSIYNGHLSAGEIIQKRCRNFVKKCLTNGNSCVNIRKLSARAAEHKRNLEKLEKSS